MKSARALRNQDRKFGIGRRDLVLKINGLTALGMQEHFEDIFGIKIVIVLQSSARQHTVFRIAKKIKACCRSQHLASRAVVFRSADPCERMPRAPFPRRMRAIAAHFKIFDPAQLYVQNLILVTTSWCYALNDETNFANPSTCIDKRLSVSASVSRPSASSLPLIPGMKTRSG